ncbi:MAG TPA: PAS domain-containing protein, partial [Crinalium sp.]
MNVQSIEQAFNLLDHMPIGACVLRDDFRVVFWNRCLEEWTRCPRAKILGDDIRSHFPRFTQPEYADPISRIMAGGPTVTFADASQQPILPCRLIGGRERVQRTTVTAYTMPGGSGFYALLSIQDLTDADSSTALLKVPGENGSVPPKAVDVEPLPENELGKPSEPIKPEGDRSQISFSLPQIPGAVYRCEGTGTWTMQFISDAIEAISGYPASDFIQDRVRPFSSIIHSEDVALLQEAAQKALPQQQIYVVEYRILHADGRVRWVYDKGQGVFDAEGQLLWFDGVIFDISDRKQIEEALQSSEERFRSLVQNSTDITTVLSEDGTILYQSPSIERILGYSPEIFVGRYAFDWLHPDDLTETQTRFDLLVRNADAVMYVEHRWRHANGAWVYLESVGSNQLENANVQGIVINTRDISDRKKIEEALRQSQGQLNSILNSLEDVVWSVAAQTGEILYYSPNAEDLYGRPASDFFGDLNLWFKVVHPDDRDRAVAACEAMRETGSQDVEYRIVRPDGEVRWVRDRARLICDAEGIPLRVDTIITDFTKRKQAEAALEQQLQKALLLGQITEEIRQSLNTQQIFQTTASQIGQAFRVSRCIILSYSVGTATSIPFVAEYLEPGCDPVLDSEFFIAKSPYGRRVLAQDRAILSDNVYTEPLLSNERELCWRLGLRSLLSVRTSYQG